MSDRDVTVIDFGTGNLLNVVRALEHCGASVRVIDQATQVSTMPDRLVLPGVGAFSDAIAELNVRGFDDLIKRYVDTGRPFLGICVGAQLLFEVGEEYGVHSGLGLIPGRVQLIPAVDSVGRSLRVPHIGWSNLVRPPMRAAWDDTILAAVKPGESMYFVHSYAPVPTHEVHRLADTYYHGVRICAAVARDQIFGCQFHPERSATMGLGILSAFLKF
ncbi:imidazole glycerol phosphate synthase subunit HisH [Acidovorax sp. D2M1]|uniref:Imidazole glycerol phosphate synthase subunit HisH n=1 Tax=Acidovorax benzenivorans TaxID=2987520 RepID=A0ABT5RTZ3_9BURK|nr:imidazole glycerol phosphate synthase subunit HisH [Acidovorax benzenivorans]MDD2177163.1 imidazole glycerol phosphate synthase subunit HisH [Acidovorax benzenivorans]